MTEASPKTSLVEKFGPALKDGKGFVVVTNPVMPERIEPLNMYDEKGETLSRSELARKLVEDMKAYFGFESFSEDTGQVENHFFIGRDDNPKHAAFLELMHPDIAWMEDSNTAWANYDIENLHERFHDYKKVAENVNSLNHD